VVGPDHFAHVFRGKACSESGRTDEVDEHHGQLPPLGLGTREGCRRGQSGRGRGSRRNRARAQGGDGGEELAAVADRDDAEPTEIVDSEFGQNLGVDVVLAERSFLLSEPEIAQPSPYVHGPGCAGVGKRRAPFYSKMPERAS
jgi:hypothetical protein